MTRSQLPNSNRVADSPSSGGQGIDGAQALEQHRSYLVRYARFHMRDAALAEDAVQDTLMAALAQIATFEGRSALRTWLTTILKRKIIDQMRRHDRQMPRDAISIDDEHSASETVFDAGGRWRDPPSDWGHPDAALESRQFWQVYETCCQHMPERQALVFSMREVMGLSTEVICKELDISTSNLHVLIYRARLSLQACMTKGWFEGLRA